MKTLKIDTGNGQVTLTYGNVDSKWDIFAGSQDAINKLEQMCIELGWVYNRKERNFLANFAAENFDKFVSDFDGEMTTGELWKEVEENKVFAIFDTTANSGKFYIDENHENCELESNAMTFKTKEDAQNYIIEHGWNDWATVTII